MHEGITEGIPEKKGPLPETRAMRIAGEFIRYDLDSGGSVVLHPSQLVLLASRSEVEKQFGFSAELLLEIGLGQEYTLMLFDRGRDKQDVSEPLLPGSRFSVSERYILVDMGFLLRANMHFLQGKDIPSVQGMGEFSAGHKVMLGRTPDYADELHGADLPSSVSRKHASLFLDLNDDIIIADCDSTHTTRVFCIVQGPVDDQE